MMAFIVLLCLCFYALILSWYYKFTKKYESEDEDIELKKRQKGKKSNKAKNYHKD